jgi:Methyltransferase domain
MCAGAAEQVFTATVLGEHQARYGLCQTCGLLFAHNPDWLNQAYQHPIAQIDTGVLRRNLFNALRLTGILVMLFDRNARLLDYAGGCGLFTRMMRDIGFDYYWHDKYCTNTLAGGFAHQPESTYCVVTALEVLEHVPDPQMFVRSMLEETSCNNIIFSTTVFEGAPPPLDWQYYAFESGQHICFYQPRTLEYLAESMGMRYVRGGDLHLFTKNPVSPIWFRLLASRWGLLAFLFARLSLRSRTQTDFEIMRAQVSKPGGTIESPSGS